MIVSTPPSGRPAARAAPPATRVFALVTVAASVAYLVWRGTTLGEPGRWWLSVPLLGIEVWGFVGFSVFLAAAWRRAEARPPSVADSGSFPRVEVFVDARGASTDDVERTLVGVASLKGAGAVTLLVDDDSADHSEISESLAHRTMVLDGRTIAEVVAGADSPLAMWLDAGQITMPDALEATVARFDESDVATCQVAVGWLSANSLARLRGGRDQDALIRRVIGPSLSERGVGPWAGAGSIVRTDALRQVIDAGPAAALTAQVRGRLLAAGWRTTYDARDLIRGVAPETLVDYLADRRANTAETWRAARLPGGALHRGAGTLPARLAPVHHLLVASAGLRQLILAMLTCVVVISGRLPFDATVLHIGAPWLITTALVTLTRRVLAGETMAVGDWTRQAWRTLPADAPALLGRGPQVRRPADVRGRRAVFGTLWPLALTILALDASILARGLTLIRPDALPRFDSTDRVLVLLWALALLVPLSDVVLGAARRRQRRTAPRLETSLPIALGETPTRTIDISPSGVGLLTDAAPAVGSVCGFELTLPLLDGGTETISGSATVRSATADPSGRVRVGLEFLNLSPDARAALIGYCGVGHAIEFVDRSPTPVEPAHLEVEGGSARKPVGGITGLAAAAGIAVLLAGPSAGVAVADAALEVEQVCVVSGESSPVAGAVVSRITPTAEEILGATGDTGCVGVAPTDESTTYVAAVGDISARAGVADAAGGVVTITLSGKSVTIIDTAGQPLAVELRTFTDGWSEPVRVDGSITLPPDGSIEAVEIRWRDTTHVVQLDQDVVIVLARLVADPDVAVIEIDRGAGWEPFEDGMEMLPGLLVVRLDDDSVVKLDVPGDHEMAIPSGTISRLDLAQELAPPAAAVSGEPTAGADPAPDADAAQTPAPQDQTTATPTAVPATPTVVAAPTPEPTSTPAPLPTVAPDARPSTESDPGTTPATGTPGSDPAVEADPAASAEDDA